MSAVNPPGCVYVPTYDDPALVAEVIVGGSPVTDRATVFP
jgi:hypothetical protein